MIRPASLVLLLLVAAIGCNGSYNERFNTTVAALKTTEPFRRDLQPEAKRAAMPEVGVTLRLPRLYDKSNVPLKTKEGTEIGLEKVNAAGAEKLSRTRPAALAAAQNFNIGSATAYDALFTNPSNQVVYGGAYFVSIDAAMMKSEQVQGMVIALVKATGASGAWTDKTVQTPSGSSLSFRYMSYEGDLTFLSDVNKTDSSAFVKTRGRADLYVYSDEARTLLAAWILPADVAADSMSYFRLAEMAMATSQFTAPADAAAPAGGIAPPVGPGVAGGGIGVPPVNPMPNPIPGGNNPPVVAPPPPGGANPPTVAPPPPM